MSQRKPKPAAKPGNPKSNTLTWQKISVPVAVIISIVTCLVGVFAFYQTQQKDTWENRLKLREQELDKVKQDMANEKTKTLATPPKDKSPVESGVENYQITILKSQTASVPPNLSITLDDVVFKPDPSRFTVNAKVTYKDLPVMQIRDGEQGYKVTYPKKDGYIIEIVKVDAVSARFAILKSSE